MNELIKIQTSQGGKQVVSGRELYDFLEIGTDFSNWFKRMFEYGFQENIDYALAKIGEPNNQPHTKTDYILTLDCAKHISMIQRTDKGMKARQYFIDAEKRLSMTQYKLPQTYTEALKQLLDKTLEQEEMQKQLEAQKPAVEFYEAVSSSTDTMDMLAVSKVLGIGRTKLFDFLRLEKILMKGNDSLPYQQYIDQGYFKVIEQSFTRGDKVGINKKVLVYQKGVDFINKRLKKFNK